MTQKILHVYMKHLWLSHSTREKDEKVHVKKQTFSVYMMIFRFKTEDDYVGRKRLLFNLNIYIFLPCIIYNVYG